MASLFSGLPFSRGSPRLTRQSSSLADNTSANVADEVKKGSWVLAQERPARQDDELESELQQLNDCLQLLIEVFPDVQIEVFREMLLNVSKESRVEVVTEHLLKDKGRWVRGRYKTIAKDKVRPGKTGPKEADGDTTSVARKEAFRSRAYRQAVKTACYAEFKGLSHATIKAVLAEHNSSYTASRPVLYQLSTKSWRYYLSSLWSKKKDESVMSQSHPLINWQTPYGEDGPKIPFLRQTDSNELNNELYETLIAPIMTEAARKRIKQDVQFAIKLNEAEATTHDALFECECCYSSVVFEEISSCSSGEHMICFQCIRFAINEALYGQGWAKTVDVDRMAVRCLAPSGNGCEAHIPTVLVQRAIYAGDVDGDTAYRKFTDRVAQQNLDKCGAPLLRCPFCTYAEVDELPDFETSSLYQISQRLLKPIGLSPDGSIHTLLSVFMLAIVMFLTPLGHLGLLVYQTLCADRFTASQKRVLCRRRGLRFQCLSPHCKATSCSACFARWTDPHVCYETTTDSLRHAIEAATTAVVKRTCPRCNTSFVKSTGCNKLVCPCGYAMCYICRSPIGQEGYAHFCQHFRVSGGRCQECDRCDLYKVEDEEAIIKRAAAKAEQDWREKEGIAALDKLDFRSRDKLGSVADEVIRGSSQSHWTLDDALDEFLDLVLA